MGVLCGALAEVGAVGHCHDFGNAYGLEAEEDAAEGVDFFPIGNDPALGDEAADVFAGGGVGDNAYYAQGVTASSDKIKQGGPGWRLCYNARDCNGRAGR